MASVGASVAISAAAKGSLLAVPAVGWAVGLAAAYFDQTILYPMMAGNRSEARFPELASLPVSEQGPGAPRTFALGARIRVPAHVMYQSSKARESSAGGSKGGTNVTQRRVFVNALVHLNDRETDELLQLIGNGQLILFNDRNLLGVTSENLTADVSGSDVLIALADEFDPDFRDTFKVGDLILPRDFVRVAGPTTFNGTYYEVTVVAGASPGTSSTLTVTPIDGQSVTSLEYTGGTPFSPAQVRRVEDALGGTQVSFRANAGGVVDNASFLYTGTGPQPQTAFQIGDLVTVRNLDLASVGGTGTTFSGFVELFRPVDGGPHTGLGPRMHIRNTTLAAIPGVTPGTNVPALAGKEIIVEFAEQNQFTATIFPETFDPVANYNSGTSTQGQPGLLISDIGSGLTSNYRGMASQGLVDCFVSAFGDQLPTNLEAILNIDPVLSWPQALEAILQRGDLLNTQIEATQVSQKPFRGAFVRGAVPVATQLQPLLVAGQILGQDRNGVICMLELDNADSVQIENGTAFSDLGARIDGQQMSPDKVQMEDRPESDMPTSVGIRFQDPDSGFSVGYEHFGLRNAEGVDHVNEQQLDLSSMSLTRREARNLASTIVRRAWVNRRTYRLTLPAAYLHLLENDLITWTDDEGNDIVARIIQRDIGQNFLINITAVRERTQLTVAGSPVQTSSTVVPQQTGTAAQVLTLGLDAPGIRNVEVTTPALQLAIADLSDTLQTATIWESQDGNSYVPVGSIGSTCAMATLAGTLSSQDSSEEYGTTTVTLRAQTVDVFWFNQGTDTLEACTQAQAEAGKNWCALLKTSDPADVEIAAFTTVTDNGDGTYTLGGWLRGLRGTTSSARDGTYALVLLNQSTGGIFRREFSGPTPTTLAYKVVPSGGDIATTDAVTFSSPTFRNVLPLPVRKLTRVYNSTAATTRILVEDSGTPTHWERTVLPLGTQPPHTLDEPFEAYRIKFYQNGAFDTLADQAVIDSRNTGTPTLRDRWFDYPDARATAAGYTPGASETYYIGVTQIGANGEGPEYQVVV